MQWINKISFLGASFIVDGVILSERGMSCLKQQTVEREKTRRRKRVGIGGEGYDPMNPNDPGGSDDDKVKSLFLHVVLYTVCFKNYSDLL